MKPDEIIDGYVIKRMGRRFGVYSVEAQKFVLSGKTLFECQEYLLIKTR